MPVIPAQTQPGAGAQALAIRLMLGRTLARTTPGITRRRRCRLRVFHVKHRAIVYFANTRKIIAT